MIRSTNPITVRLLSFLTGLLLLSGGLVNCGKSSDSSTSESSVVIYSGRGEGLVKPVLDEIESEVPFEFEVRYSNTPKHVNTIMEEGKNSPADLFYAQDAGGLGKLQKEGFFTTLPDELLQQVDERFRSDKGKWIGITGRARVVNYNTNMVDESELPESIWDLTKDRWKGKVGWAPRNASFQASVTALRHLEGEERARKWLNQMMNNDVRNYKDNSPIVHALANGEIALGLVNNYYLQREKQEHPDWPVATHHTKNDAGSMVNVSGAAVLKSSDNKKEARTIIRKLLAKKYQEKFASGTFEYPLHKDVSVKGNQVPLKEIPTPDLDLSEIHDLQKTIELLKDVGAL